MRPNFVLIQETHFNENHRLRIRDYQVFTDLRGNGTAVLAKSNIVCFKKQVALERIYGSFIEIEVEKGDLNWLIGSIYIPCSSSHSSIKKDLKTLNQLAGRYHCIFGGDLNARHPSWCTRRNITGVAINRWLNAPDNNLIRVSPDRPTRDRSKLDHFLLSRTNFGGGGLEATVFDTFADHKGVLLQGRLTSPLLNIISYDRPVKDFARAKWDLFEETINEEVLLIDTPSHHNATNSEIDCLISTVNRIIHEAEDISVPILHKHNNKYVNIPPALTELFKTRQKLKKTFRRERRKNNPVNWKMVELKHAIAQTSLKITAETSSYMKKTIEDKILNLKPGNQFYKEVNRITGRKNNRKIDHLIINNNQIYNPQSIKEEITSFYSNLYKEQTPHTLDLNIPSTNITQFSEDNSAISPTAQNSPFTTTLEVRDIIRKINSKKSSGPDEISNFILKRLPFSLIKILTIIFNQCINNNHFPAVWKTAKIFPIPKSKNPTAPENFRPISLTSNMGKILEAIIMRTLLEEIEARKIIPDHQFGFRSGHSTLDALSVVKNDVSRSLNHSKTSIICLLDFEKAFDSVWSRGLLSKMNNMNINNNTTAIIQSFLSDRSADVMIDNAPSLPFPIERGVPQGTRLGPILYNIYISDIPTEMATSNECKIVQYADDTIVYATSLNPLMANIKLQRTMDELERYFQKWGLTINAAKTKVKIFTPQTGNKSRKTERHAKRVSLTIKNTKILPSPELKYLGVIFNNRMKFKQHVEISIRRATGAFFRIAPILKKTGVDNRLKALLYKQLIRPIVTYGFPIWISASKTAYQLLEKMERRIMRAITGKYRRDTIDGLRWFPERELRKDTGIENIIDHLELLMERHLKRTYDHPNGLISEQMSQEIDNEDYFVTTRHLDSIGVGEYARQSKVNISKNRG